MAARKPRPQSLCHVGTLNQSKPTASARLARQIRLQLRCFERRVLDVVLGRVFVDEPVDRVGIAVGVVDLHERLPLFGQAVLGEDRLDRALGFAGAAVDAFLRVDDQDPLELVDAVDGADVHAGAVFDVDAGLCDDVGHAPYSSGASRSSITPEARSWRADFASTWSKPAACARRSPAVSVWLEKPTIGMSG